MKKTCSFLGKRKNPVCLYIIIWVKFGVFRYFAWDCSFTSSVNSEHSRAALPCRPGPQDTIHTLAHKCPRNNKNPSTRIPNLGIFSRHTRGVFYTRAGLNSAILDSGTIWHLLMKKIQKDNWVLKPFKTGKTLWKELLKHFIQKTLEWEVWHCLNVSPP